MDPLTIFLAKLIGPAVLVVGLGMFFSRAYYAKAYRNLEKETLGILLSGLTALVIGIVIVINHNSWDNPLAGFVSLVGWLSIGKGVMLVIFPKMVDKVGDAIAKSFWVRSGAVIYSIAGAYITYLAFLG
jgi:hypothetical protein